MTHSTSVNNNNDKQGKSQTFSQETEIPTGRCSLSTPAYFIKGAKV